MTTISWSYIGQSLFAILAGINSSLPYDYYCHQIICCNKEVKVSTCLLQYVEFIAMRSLCCINLLPRSLSQRLAMIFPVVTGFFSCSVVRMEILIA